jgi:uncharacterized membrane protein
MQDVLLLELTRADQLALVWFLVAWLGYGPLIHTLQRPRSISFHMHGVRRAWMHAMLGRDNRITDASLLASCVQSATFFASTTMLALAALVGAFGYFDQTYEALSNLTFTVKSSRPVVEFKFLLLALVFARNFLQLTWAVRKLNYCLALVGGAPLKPDAQQRRLLAERTSHVLTMATSSLNAGIQGYYFALAVLSWFFGPIVLLTATSGLVGLLLWRQLGSETGRAIRLSNDAYMRVTEGQAAPEHAALGSLLSENRGGEVVPLAGR